MPISGVGQLTDSEASGRLTAVGLLAINALRRIEVSQAQVVPASLRVPNSGNQQPVPLLSLSTRNTNFSGRGFYRQSADEGDNPSVITLGTGLGLLPLGAPRFVAIPTFLNTAPVPQYGRRYGNFQVARQALDRANTVLGGFRWAQVPESGPTLALDVWLTPTELRLGDLSYTLTVEEQTALRTYQDFRLDVYRTSGGFWAALGLSRDFVLGGLTTSPEARLGPISGPFTGAVTNLYAIASNLAVNGLPPTRLVETDHTSCIALGSEAVPLRALRVGGTTMRGEPWSRCFARGRTNLAVEWSGIETIQQAGTYSAP